MFDVQLILGFNFKKGAVHLKNMCLLLYSSHQLYFTLNQVSEYSKAEYSWVLFSQGKILICFLSERIIILAVKLQQGPHS